MSMRPDIESNIGELIIFQKQPSRFDEDYCQHLHVSYSEDLAQITCKDCKEKLDPIKWVLAHMELLRKYKEKVDLRRAQFELIEKRLESKARFCCTKCGEMNDIDFTKMISTKAVQAKIKLLED